MYHYVTCNGEATGRASPYYRSRKIADADCAARNEKATKLGAVTRYVVRNAYVKDLSEAGKYDIKDEFKGLK